ncbi:MAG: prepilin peptidase [Clostridiaceae bacterium]
MAWFLENLILLGLLALAVYHDITRRKIPNKITMPAILFGIIYSTVNSGLNGFLFSIFGFLLGLAVFLIPYIFGGIGAGDVKLMAAIGALKGSRFALMSSIGTALSGGMIVIIYMIYKGGLSSTIISSFGLLIKPISKWIFLVTGNKSVLKVFKYFEGKQIEKVKDYIPYAIAIACGTISVLFGAFDGLLAIV